jgi:pyruvate,orthophosphate dikinase
VQDVEFTIEEGRLWILQARRAKRTPLATVKTAVDMAQEGLISQEEAVRRVDPESLGQMLGTSLTDASAADILAQGIESSPGAVSGRVALDVDQVEQMAREGEPVILVREKTTPDDAAVMPLVSGILTRHGGATSHAAVVARGLGKPCVVGCEAMEIDVEQGRVHFGEVIIASGDEISIDGSTGTVFAGRKELVAPCLSEASELDTLLTWADDLRRLRVLADVSTPAEIEVARELGAEGIGILRTERLYYDADFLPPFREAILAESQGVRRESLDELRSLHGEEFRAVFDAARGLPVTVRLLNAPLEHFLPSRDALLTELAELRLAQRWSEDIERLEEMLRAVDGWTEANPEYGLRGARLAVAAPDVVRAQLEALFDAAAAGCLGDLRILVPCVSFSGELEHYLQAISTVADMADEREGKRIALHVGAAIETARAALVADQLASKVDFLCFDGEGLTASVLSCSQEERGKFLPGYMDEGIIGSNAFSTADEEGVGSLIRLAVERARSGRPDIEIGIYGSHCQEPASMRLLHEWGIDAVVCDLSHLLAARLSAAQAVVR